MFNRQSNKKIMEEFYVYVMASILGYLKLFKCKIEVYDVLLIVTDTWHKIKMEV